MVVFFFFQAEDGIRDLVRSRGLGDVYKRQSLANMFRSATKEGWREAARLVSDLAQPGEAIFFDQGVVQVPFDYYYHRSGLQLHEYGYPRDYTYWEEQASLEGDQWWVIDYLATDPSKALTRLAGAAQEYSAVWLAVNRPMSGGRFCLLYTSDAADDLLCVDLGGRRIIKKKKQTHTT